MRRAVALEEPGEREFAELVAYHLLGDVDLQELPAVVHQEPVPHELGDDGAGPRPGFDILLVAALVHFLDLFQQLLVHKRTFFRRSAHLKTLRYADFDLRLSCTIIQPQIFRLALVLKPREGWFHGERGTLLPLEWPLPPPRGWSTAFMAAPRTVGFTPMWRWRPALPRVMVLCSILPTWPMVARQALRTLRISPEGILMRA